MLCAILVGESATWHLRFGQYNSYLDCALKIRTVITAIFYKHWQECGNYRNCANSFMEIILPGYPTGVDIKFFGGV